MSTVLLFVSCLVLGIIMRQTRLLAPAALNRFIIAVLLPAVALLHVHELRLEPSLVVAVAAPWVLFGAGVLFFVAVGRLWRLRRDTIGCLILAGALGNTSFVGYPAILAFYGADALGIGIIADQLGTFLILSLFGGLVAASASRSETSARSLAYRIFTFPPFVALLVALALKPVAFPAPVVSALTLAGHALTPLALVAVGLQLQFAGWRGRERVVALGLAYKLLVGPALVWLAVASLGVEWTRAVEVSLFEAAMPPMITGALVAIDHGLDEPLATLLVGIGIPLSLVTLPLWFFALGR